MATVFYYAPMSSSTRVHVAIEELGLTCEKKRLDLKAGDAKAAEYKAMNPNGQVPLLVVDGTPLFESLAILIHLGDQHGVEKGLWPALKDKARLDALAWSTWGTVSLGAPLTRYMHAGAAAPAEQRNEAAAKAALEQVHERCAMLEARLTSHKFILGDAYSLVDTGVASMTWWATGGLKIDLDKYARTLAWTKGCMERPAAKRVMEIEMQGMKR